jgi:hypothetical protein
MNHAAGAVLPRPKPRLRGRRLPTPMITLNVDGVKVRALLRCGSRLL